MRHSSPLILATCAWSVAFAQPTPGSITTHKLLIGGPSVLDASVNVYTTGVSTGQIPTTAGAAQTKPGGGSCFQPIRSFGPCPDAFIVKVGANGNVIFASLLGGPTDDEGTAVNVDAAGNVYATGSTQGSFPTTPNAAIPISTTSKTFAAKLSADGSEFLYSTYLPSPITSTSGIAVDAQGNSYITGRAATHAYVAKLSADGSSMLYTTILGGSNQESGTAIVVDPGGNAYVTGPTTSPDFPVTAGVLQTKLAGTQNAFVTKLDPSGKVVFSTYFGGSVRDTPNALQIDPAGNVYVVGLTQSLNLPTTPGSLQPAPLVPLWSPWPGGFVAKLTPDGSAVAFASYVSTDGFGVTSVAIGASGDVYINGSGGPGFPMTPSAPEPCALSGFVAHLDPEGALLDSSYGSGGTANDPYGFALASDGSLLVVTSSTLQRIRFGDPGWSAPACLSANEFNSATLTQTGVAPGEFITLAGYAIGPDAGVTAPAGVQVFFDGKPAPVTYAQSRQVNVQVPFEIAGQTQTAITLHYNGATLGPLTVPVLFAGPGLFRLQPNVSTQAYVVNQDGTLNSPSNPAARGSTVSFWGTGFGSTIPACATGALNAPGPVNLDPNLTVVLSGDPGGSQYQYFVRYAGGAPTLPCGITQINAEIPTDVAPGPMTVYPSVGKPGPNGIAYRETDVGATIYLK